MIFRNCWIFQAEKGLQSQLTLLNTQLKQSQETLREKEKSALQLQAELKTTQGSLSQEVTKHKAQVSELQASLAKKARTVFLRTNVS